MDEQRILRLVKAAAELQDLESAVDGRSPRTDLSPYPASRPFRRWRTYVLPPIAVAAAACLFLLVRTESPGVEITRFALTGSRGQTDQFYVDVEADRPCWVRLFARTESGALFVENLSLSGQGSSEKVTQPTQFGPFQSVIQLPGRAPLRISHLLLVASRAPITDLDANAAIPDVLAVGGNSSEIQAAFEDLARSLERRFGWEIGRAHV